jgi:hypothetical protein
MSQPSHLQFADEFFRKERDAYDDWIRAFWRELFQNSLDAGSKRIDITIDDAVAPKSVFGEALNHNESRVRVTFGDYGHGMDFDTLSKVYFSIGETTKKDGSGMTGGFGRGRIITCAANDRYSIITRDNYVEGQGGRYYCERFQDAISRKSREVSKAIEQGNWNAVEDCHTEIEAIEKHGIGHDGFLLEVDFDPTEYGPYSHRNPTAQRLREALDGYLRQAQIDCDVYIDGDKFTERLVRGKMVREIVTTDPETHEDKLLGRVHVTKSGNSFRFGGQVIFRIDGAPMMSRSIDSPHQVIVEVDKANHRAFLTSNRDGFKFGVQGVVNGFIDELVVDSVTALDAKRHKEDLVRSGAKGTLEIQVGWDELQVDAVPEERIQEVKQVIERDEKGMLMQVSRSDFMSDEVYGVPINIFNRLLDDIEDEVPTFLDSYDDQNAVGNLRHRLQRNGRYEAWDNADQKLLRYMFAVMNMQITAAQQRARPKHQMYDMHIKIEDPTPEVRRVMRSYDPENWDLTTGKGRTRRALFEAWTAACEAVCEEVTKIEPNVGRIKLRTGWHFSGPQTSYIGVEERQHTTLASHSKDDDGHHLLLLNPVTNEGKPAYKTSSRDDLAQLLALAVHEASHVVTGPRHGQEFAYMMTKLSQRIWPQTNRIVRLMEERMKEGRMEFERASTAENKDGTPRPVW